MVYGILKLSLKIVLLLAGQDGAVAPEVALAVLDEEEEVLEAVRSELVPLLDALVVEALVVCEPVAVVDVVMPLDVVVVELEDALAVAEVVVVAAVALGKAGQPPLPELQGSTAQQPLKPFPQL